MPASVFVYTTGSTIKKLMNTARLPALRSHISARMIKLATGMDLMVSISGRSSTSTQRSAAASAASKNTRIWKQGISPGWVRSNSRPMASATPMPP